MKPLSLRLLNKVKYRAKNIPSGTSLVIAVLLIALGISPFALLLSPFLKDTYIFPLYLLLVIFARNTHIKTEYKLSRNWLKPSYIDGRIRFYNDHFVLKPKKKAASKVELKNIASIKLEHAMYNGYTWGTKGIILHSGACKLSLKPKDGSNTLQFRFVINDEDDLKQITAHLKHWYQLGIEIEEREPVNNDRSVLFRTDWTYEQYQELKEELGVKEFFKKGY